MSVDRGLVRSPQKSHNKGAWAGGSLLAILDALQDPLLSEQSSEEKCTQQTPFVQERSECNCVFTCIF